MSYILEALRKSDQQRQRGAAPTLLTTQATMAAPRQRAFLFYGLLAVVLIGAGIAIGWLRPWQTEQAAPATEPVAAKPLASSVRQTAPETLTALPETARNPVQQSVPIAPPAPAPVIAMKQDTPVLAKTGTRVPPTAATAPAVDAQKTVPEKPVSTVPAEPAPESRVMTLAELPASVQQEIPKMMISVHVYSSKPKDRLVSINDHILREGDTLSSGLRLEQITPDDIIFSYKGYRFRRGVQ